LEFLCKIALAQGMGRAISVLLGFLTARAEATESEAVLRGKEVLWASIPWASVT